MKMKSVVMAVILTALVASAAAQAESGVKEHSAFKVEVKGSGAPMILIPGLASSGAVWDSTVAHYAGKYKCYVLMLAGFAGVPPVKDFSLQQVREQLADYIESNHLEKPVIVGHSLGGFLALDLAAAHPDDVGKLVIVDSLPELGAAADATVTPAQLKSNAERMRDGMAKQDEVAREKGTRMAVESMVTAPADVERVVGWGKESDPATVREAMYEVMSADIRGELGKIKAPTLVLGTWIAYQGYGVTEADVRKTFDDQFANLKGVRIEIAPKARHFIMYDQPDWMFAQMDGFLGVSNQQSATSNLRSATSN